MNKQRHSLLLLQVEFFGHIIPKQEASNSVVGRFVLRIVERGVELNANIWAVAVETPHSWTRSSHLKILDSWTVFSLNYLRQTVQNFSNLIFHLARNSEVGTSMILSKRCE